MKRRFTIIIMTLIVLVLLLVGCTRASTNIEDYMNTGKRIDANAKDVMPSIEDLQVYEDVSFVYTNISLYVFESDSFVLDVKYDAKTYEKEKANVVANYNFLAEPLASPVSEGEYLIPDVEFNVNSYTFKVVSGNDDDNTQFPKSFGMIATSDDELSIAYLYFHDFDLDMISNGMEDFVADNFEYEF